MSSSPPIDLRDRLQPALLDRLTDDSRLGTPDPQGDRRVMSKAQMRAAVLRDLAWLFNAVQPLGAAAAADPQVAGSVLNFGLPPLAGQLASRLDITQVEKIIRDAIVRFEPRILAETLRVQAIEASSVLDTHNIIEFEIWGELWAQPAPLEILLRTRLDLEAGQAVVRETSGRPRPARR